VTTFPTERIHNVVLVGHAGVGKTTLAEALLARAGAIPRAGKVDDGTSVLDTEPESVKSRISMSLTLAPFEWTATDGQTYKVNVLDTPGAIDFAGEVDAAMSIADLAVFVVSAVEGVEPQTEMLWRRAAAMQLPRMIFVSKEDKDRADFHLVLQQLKDAFGSGIAPLELPLGEAASLHGVVDVLSEEALDYDASGARHAEPLPSDVADEEHTLHDALIEEIVSGDDDQLERYLSGDTPSVAELERTLAREVLECLEFPVLLGSAATGVGIDRLADLLCELSPTAADRATAVVAGESSVDVPADPAAQPLLHVFKTIADPYIGQLSVFKVLSGTVRADDRLVNSTNGTDERLHGLFLLRGKDQTPVNEVVAGDIAAVSKLANTRTGDTLAPKGTPVRVAGVARRSPQYGVAIVPRTQADDDKLGNALARIQAEDPSLYVDRVEETRQTVLRGLGDTHIQVTIDRIARKFGVNVDLAPLRVAYRETVAGRAEAEGKLKKQSGGHGQFAVVNLRVDALPRGEGFVFKDATVGGSIPRNYIPAVQTGVEETMARGGVHGFPVVDVAVECYDGKYHSVDSSEMAFKTAASQGFKDAMESAGVLVLEPVSLLTVTVPSAYQGDVMSDVTTRRGRVQGSSTNEHGEQVIEALVPAAEVTRYAIDLRSMTGGRGQFEAQHHHYDVLPQHLVEKAKQTLPKQH
jgi:elongation factor G